jgi:hypothetical protein
MGAAAIGTDGRNKAGCAAGLAEIGVLAGVAVAVREATGGITTPLIPSDEGVRVDPVKLLGNATRAAIFLECRKNQNVLYFDVLN